MTNSIPQTVVLIVMNKIMMNVVVTPSLKIDSRMAPTTDLTIVNFSLQLVARNTFGSREFIVILMTSPFGERSMMMFQAWLGIWSTKTQACNPDVRSHCTNQWSGGKTITEYHSAFGSVFSSITS